MRKCIFFIWGMMTGIFACSQKVQTWTENFNGAVSFYAIPTNSWFANTTNSLSISKSNVASYTELIPVNSAISFISEMPFYNSFIEHKYI